MFFQLSTSNAKYSVRNKSFEGTFSFSNCHIIGLDNGSLVLIVSAKTIVDDAKLFFPSLFILLDVSSVRSSQLLIQCMSIVLR
jgi:hypothetical protein